MKKNALLVSAMAVALSMSIAACSGTSSNNSSSTSANTSSTTQEQSKGGDSDFDAVEAYYGQWRGSVEFTGTTVYGSAGGTEQMLDVNLEKDGTCTVEPLAAHADLLTDEGTWEGTEDSITLHLSSGDIVISLESDVKGSADAKLFDIADFDTILFDFYG